MSEEYDLWILVSEQGLEAYSSLDESVASFDNFVTFVVEQGKIVCLTHNPTKNGEEWSIESVGYPKIAEAFLKRMEK